MRVLAINIIVPVAVVIGLFLLSHWQSYEEAVLVGIGLIIARNIIKDA